MGNPKLPKLWIEYEVKSKDGKLLSKGKLKSQSWVGNIVALISCMFDLWSATSGGTATSASRADMKDVGGTARGFRYGGAAAGNQFGGRAPAGDTSAGIVVGSSDIPVSLDQYSLQALIPHGTGSGQLQYSAVDVQTLIKGTNVWTLRIVRTFTNASGGSVTVRELGLYLRAGDGGTTIMLARDVPASPISIPDGSTLTLRYIITHSL